MKNKSVKLRSILAIALTTVMVITTASCSKSGGDSSGGGFKSLNSVDDLKGYLDSQPANKPDKPIKVKLSISEQMVWKVAEAIKSAGKYVSLDLSGSLLAVIPRKAFKDSNGLLVSITLDTSSIMIGEAAYSGKTGPGGGKVFYYKSTGFTMTDSGEVCHYLEAAPVSDNIGHLIWSNSYKDIEGTELEIGTGRKNTALILAADPSAPAAKACKDYSGGGKTDWFLPSRDELDMLYICKNYVGYMGSDYWSSSQELWYSAWHQRFSDGSQFNGDDKNNTFVVRAIRAF